VWHTNLREDGGRPEHIEIFISDAKSDYDCNKKYIFS
jgi:hypothetical protein